MLGWLRRTIGRRVPACPWSVRVADGVISTSDGRGTSRDLRLAKLKSVVVATDDSGPWGDDFVFLLYSDGPDPFSVFPLEANGRSDFVDWMSRQPGYFDSEMRKPQARPALRDSLSISAIGSPYECPAFDPKPTLRRRVRRSPPLRPRSVAPSAPCAGRGRG